MRPSVDRRELVAVFAGGVVGALARAALADALPRETAAWPWATFACNLLGAALLGAVAARLSASHAPGRHWRAFLGAGLCGALTTFATLQLELVDMLDARAYALAATYATASLALGLGVVAAASHLLSRPEAP